MPSPLQVHFVFHPRSQRSRDFACSFHRTLYGTRAQPLRIPTVLLAEDGTDLPPSQHRLEGAERVVVIALADDEMIVETALPPGRVSWPDFVAGLADQCTQAGHLFLPVQMSPSAWPLHPRFNETNFFAAHSKPDAERSDWLERRLIIELCRFMMGCGRGDKVPIKIFLSHAKQDIKVEPQLFSKLTEHLSVTQPVEAWVDSSQIEGGSNFRTRIEDGIRASAVLVLGTAHYSSRPWCRREVLCAKQNNRPIVVVDGLQGIDVRSFPYLGNVPVVSWSADRVGHAVDLLLKEHLRMLHAQLLLQRDQRDGDAILPGPPELLTLATLPRGTPVLYPDPPLGDEEADVLEPLGHRLQTPLQRAGSERVLTDRAIAISVSRSDDFPRFGVLPDHLDAALLEVSRHLLARGATLAYGGHLGDEGYTVALFDIVDAHQKLSTLPPVERITNYVAWPRPFAQLPPGTLASFQKFATYRRTARPDGVEHLEPQTFVAEPRAFAADSPARRFAWARGLTAMRDQQTAETHARVLMGGMVGPTHKALPEGGSDTAWYSGRIPGVVEEGLLTLQAKRPLYLCGAFGGAAALLIDLLEGRDRADFTWAFHKQAPFSDELRQLYADNALPWWDYPEMARFAGSVGVEGLSAANGLSNSQNRELFRTRDAARLVELILTGLAAAVRRES